MLRSFVDINGNIQYVPFAAYSNQMNSVFQPIYVNDPYSNSSLIVTPTYSDEQKPNITGYNVYQRPIFYTNPTYSDVNNDPELRKKVVRYLFKKFETAWLPYTFIKLQKYLKNTNGEISFIKTFGEYDKEIINDNAKVEFIIENILTKREFLIFLDKFVNKNNANWYDLKNKHIDKIKYELYDKLKNHMKKIVIKHI